MRLFVLGLAATGLLAGCADYGGGQSVNSQWRNYDYNRPDPGYGDYQAERYYREDTARYRERRMSNSERLYRGNDGRYYCRRSDGTTGLVVGAITGGVLGNVIAPGGSKTLGTVLGGVVGGVAGRQIDRGRQSARCR